MSLTLAGLREFAAKPLLAVLCTVGPSGAPQAAVVWYTYDSDAFEVTSFADRAKVRNIRRNPKVSLVVADTVAYGPPLVVVGAAEVRQEGALDLTLRHCARYQGEAQARASAARYSAAPRVVIRITPRKLLVGQGAESVGWPLTA